MKKLTLLITALAVVLSAGAATNITSPTVSGHWTLAGSPYKVYNDINVPGDSTLSIDPGVEVIFQGYYGMIVDGFLQASGTATNVIKFHVQDTTGWSVAGDSLGSWKGIMANPIWGASIPVFTLKYCNIYDAKGNGLDIEYRPVDIKNCNYFHNGSGMKMILDSAQGGEIAYCNIYDNAATNWGRLLFIWGLTYLEANYSSLNIHDCNVYNNQAGMDIICTDGLNVLFQKNVLKNNSTLDTTLGSILDISHGNNLISDDSIYSNTTIYDGAVCFYYGNSDLNRNYICNNQTLIGYNGSSACGSIEGGGGIRLSSEASAADYTYVVRNNIIANNHAELAGGGVYVFFANATIVNNQIINNTSTDGAGIYIFNNQMAGSLYDTMVIVKNNIMYGNYNPGNMMLHNFSITGDSTLTVLIENNWFDHPLSQGYINHFSSLWFTWAGDTTKNIMGTDPGLVAPTSGWGVGINALGANFNLKAGSPCIDKGDTTGLNSTIGAADVLNHHRIFGSKIDIGAYEYGAGAIDLSATPTVVATTQNAIDIYPNPAMNVAFISTPSSSGTISIIDAAGMQVLQKNISGTLTALNVNSMPRGAYFVQWSDAASGAKSVKKLALQ